MKNEEDFYLDLLPERRGRGGIFWPPSLEEDDLLRDWNLSPADRVATFECRGAGARVQFALQLCMVRRYGRFLPEGIKIPRPLLDHIGSQLELKSEDIVAPSIRASTRGGQFQRLVQHLGFRWYEDDIAEQLRQWLTTIAPVSQWNDDLWDLVEKKLFEWQIILPGASILARLLAGVASQVQGRLLQQVYDHLSPDLLEAIDRVLSVDPGSRRSRFFRLKSPAPKATAKVLVSWLDQYDFLHGLNLKAVDLTGLGVFVERYAQRVKRADIAEIREWKAPKRYVATVCFLMARYRTTLEELLDLHIQFEYRLEKNAKQAFELKKKILQKDADTAAEVLTAYAKASFEEKDRARISLADFQHKQNPPRVQWAIRIQEEYQRFKKMGLCDELRLRHPTLRQYIGRFFDLPFEWDNGCEWLGEVLETARSLHHGRLAVLPEKTPVDFVPATWRKGIIQENAAIDRAIWEFALARSLREGLQLGWIHLKDTRRYAAFCDLVFTDQEWQKRRDEFYAILKLPRDFKKHLRELNNQMDAAAQKLAKGLPKNEFVSVEEGRWVFHRDDALPTCPEVDKLRDFFDAELPKVTLERVMAEVDGWCNYITKFYSMGEHDTRDEQSDLQILAVIAARATNQGISAMGRSSRGMDVLQLINTDRRCIRPGTIRAANVVAVNFHHGLELSATWGRGRFCSADGKRYGVRASSVMASCYPRRMGFRKRAANIYDHLSDQHSVFSSDVFSCSLREAPFALGGINDNDTDLELEELTTDTHGYTEPIFGFCELLGIFFLPRIKDLDHQRIYKIDPRSHYGALDPVFEKAAEVQHIENQWDMMVRTMASLYSRKVSAPQLLRHFHGSKNPLARAFQEYGRIIKTIHILKYLHDEKLRRRIHLQLNRGEAHHDLAGHLSFGQMGEFCSADMDQMLNRATCLSLLCNVIVVWNTVYLQKLIDRRQQEGRPIDPKYLERISPVFWNHISLTGTYDFIDAKQRLMAEREVAKRE